MGLNDFILITNWTAVILRTLATYIVARYVIPLQIKEASVKNGLAILRKQLLIVGVIIILLNIISIAFIVLRVVVDESVYRFSSGALTIINAIASLGISIIAYQMYHQQYTPRQKELHKKIAKEEEKRNK